jgi:hypothetical protein
MDHGAAKFRAVTVLAGNGCPLSRFPPHSRSMKHVQPLTSAQADAAWKRD